MKRTVFFLLMFASLSVVALSQKTAVSYEAITVSSTAVGIGSATLDPADGAVPTECYGRVETESIRYRCDGTNPTSSEGILVQATETIHILGRGNMENIKFIATGSDGTLRLHCYE